VTIPFRTAIAATTLLTLGACSQSETPFIDMCQRIAGNLANDTVENWAEAKKSKDDFGLNVTVGYTTASGNSGNAVCSFAAQGDNFDASPNKVLFNGEKVGFRDLMAASAKASGKIVKDTAKETGERATKLAGEAQEKAGELADQARDLAADAKVRGSELADQAGEKAQELTAKAKEIAGEAGDKAREAALDATKALQEKLEQ